MPCFWIYYQLGCKGLSEGQLTHNPYKEWIATYSDPSFVATAEKLAETINQMCKASTPEIQAQMHDIFDKAVGFELEFFEESFNFTALYPGVYIS